MSSIGCKIEIGLPLVEFTSGFVWGRSQTYNIRRSPNPRIAGSIKVMSNFDMIERAPLLMMSGITSRQGTSSLRPTYGFHCDVR